jgi:hypothetical protein
VEILRKVTVNSITAATSASAESHPGSCEDSSLVQNTNHGSTPSTDS